MTITMDAIIVQLDAPSLFIVDGGIQGGKSHLTSWIILSMLEAEVFKYGVVYNGSENNYKFMPPHLRLDNYNALEIDKIINYQSSQKCPTPMFLVFDAVTPYYEGKIFRRLLEEHVKLNITIFLCVTNVGLLPQFVRDSSTHLLLLKNHPPLAKKLGALERDYMPDTSRTSISLLTNGKFWANYSCLMITKSKPKHKDRYLMFMAPANYETGAAQNIDAKHNPLV